MTSMKVTKLGSQLVVIVYDEHKTLGIRGFDARTPMTQIIEWLVQYAEKVSVTY